MIPRVFGSASTLASHSRKAEPGTETCDGLLLRIHLFTRIASESQGFEQLCSATVEDLAEHLGTCSQLITHTGLLVST